MTDDSSENLCPTLEEILEDPCASRWIKVALQSALQRDPVDAANDAEFLAQALQQRCEQALRSGVEAAIEAACQPAGTVNYLREVQAAEPSASCHVCGAMMIATKWKCLSCGAGTEGGHTVTTAVSIGEGAENLYVFGDEHATRTLQERLWELERLRALVARRPDHAL